MFAGIEEHVLSAENRAFRRKKDSAASCRLLVAEPYGPGASKDSKILLKTSLELGSILNGVIRPPYGSIFHGSIRSIAWGGSQVYLTGRGIIKPESLDEFTSQPTLAKMQYRPWGRASSILREFVF